MIERDYFKSSSPFTTKIIPRLMAKMIDLFIATILSIFLYPIGIILATLYLAIADSLNNGCSIGKKFVGLRVISLEDHSPCNLQQSIIRNLPFLIPPIFLIIPFTGIIFACFTGIPLILFEVYLIIQINSRNRLGDLMADTTVISRDDKFQNSQTTWFSNNKDI